MSFVVNILLNMSPEEFWCDDTEVSGELADSCGPLDNLNQWIPDGILVNLTKATYQDDAGYGMDACLFGGGFKDFDTEGFIKLVESQAWKVPGDIQLFVKAGEEHSFRFVELDLPHPPRRSNRTIP
jgi:hypothetical protein